MAESISGDSPVPTLVDHWDAVYRGTAPEQLSWHESAPLRSLEAILESEPWVDASIVDVGGGDATLVDLLLQRGYRNLTVVDIAAEALARAQARLGDEAELVDWVADDVGAPLDVARTPRWPRAPFAVWHDRAVFHYLRDPAQQQAYIARLEAMVAHAGHVILATFDATGPDHCSGLPVVRRSLEGLSRVLPSAFELTAASRFTHITPTGAEQAFVRCAWQRVR
jgi:SAM-dependent methyltransferase